MGQSKLKVQVGSIHGGDTRVWLDGQEITKKVRAVDIRVAADEVAQANIELAFPTIELDGQVVTAMLHDVSFGGEMAEVMSMSGGREFITSQPHYRDGSGDEQPQRIEEPVRPGPLPPAPHKTGEELTEDGRIDKNFVPGPLTVYVDEERAGTARWAMYAIETGALINQPLKWVEFAIFEGEGRDQGQHVIETPERVEVQEERSETGVVIERTMKIRTRKATA